MKKLTTIMAGLLCAAGIAQAAVITFTDVDPNAGTIAVSGDGYGTFIAGQTLGDGDVVTSLSYTVTNLTIDAHGVSNDVITVALDVGVLGGDTINWDVIEFDHNNGVFNAEGEGISFGVIGVTGTLSGGADLVVNSAKYTGWTFRRWNNGEVITIAGDVTNDTWMQAAPDSDPATVPLNDTFFSATHVSGGSWNGDDFAFTVDVSDGLSALAVDPSSVSMTLNDPDVSTNATIDASIVLGVSSNDIEIISTVTDDADFTAVASGTTLSSVNPNETITVTYTNPGDLVNNGDVANATLSVEWTDISSGVTNITEVPLDVLYSKFSLVGPATDRSMSTPNDRLRVAFQYAAADSVEMAVLNAADAKLDFTAYDDHAANTARAIYTTKTSVPSAVTNQASDFTESGFFSNITEPFTVDIPVDNSGAASTVVELVDLVNNAWTWKDNAAETVVFIDLASISEISNLVADVDLTIEITAKSGASTLVSEVDVTITPDGTVSYSFVANGASYAETNGIEVGSNDGGSGNPFTGNQRHQILSAGSDQDQVASGQVNDKAFGMFFDTDSSGFLLDNILLNLSNDSTPVLPVGGALLKLELWKINDDLGNLSTTNVATTFPDPELVFTGTGLFTDTYNDDDLYQIDLPNITLDAETRYGWVLRWNTTKPANFVVGVDRGPTTVEGSFDAGNHLRLNNINVMFPFYGVTDGEGAGAWDIVFHIRSGDPSTYEAWVDGYGLVGSDADKDADVENGGLGDGYDNLMEYALGMDPTAEDAGSMESIHTVADGSTNYFEYVHARRADYAAHSLTYDLIDTENLVYTSAGLATNSQDEVIVGAVVGSYETVTNRYVTDKAAQFIELNVKQD